MEIWRRRGVAKEEMTSSNEPMDWKSSWVEAPLFPSHEQSNAARS